MPNVPIMFNAPVALKAKIDEESEKRDIPVSALIRQAVAAFLDFKLKPTDLARAKKYATVEERIEAQKKREKERKELINALLAKYRSGAIELTEDDLESDEDEEEEEA